MLAIILAVAVRYVVGYQQIIYVSESTSDKDLFSGENDDIQMCCVNENCSCNSLDQALANLTSNVLINITTDATLSSFIRSSHLENVSIIGHNNPTVHVDCKNFAGVHFASCNNCIIQGIVWNGCGTENTDNYTELIATLKLSESSNVTIQNCTFLDLIGQAVVLSEVSGEVNIRDCNFVNNSYDKDDGAIVYYAVSQCFHHLFAMHNCNFTCNKGKSLVYIKNNVSRCNTSNFSIIFDQSYFCYNQGTPIYLVNQRLYITGKVLFQCNKAKSAAGIYISDHSTVVFGENSNVKFVQNSAYYKGGAFYLENHSSLIVDQDSVITFKDNSVTSGTIYSEVNSNVSFKGNCQVTFNCNSNISLGATIYSLYNSHITFTENSSVIFSKYTVDAAPTFSIDRCIKCSVVFDNGKLLISISVIFLFNHSHVSFEGSSTTLFKNNNARPILSCLNSTISFGENSIANFSNNRAQFGGAIYLSNHGHLSFEGSSNTMFSNNSADYAGGAIYLCDHGHIIFEGSSTTSFVGNNANLGGAIVSYLCSSISLRENSKINFSNNRAQFGGAIYLSNYGHLSFEESSTTVFSTNSADQGGAIYLCDYGHIIFEGSSTTLFVGNNAYSGGAIVSYLCSSISLRENSKINFSNNRAQFGGAIYLSDYGHIIFEGSSKTLFVGNNAYSGGAIASYLCSTILFRENSNSTTRFSNNSASYEGGAMHLSDYSNIYFNGTSTTMFSNNSANYHYGGAIHLSDYSNIYFNGKSTTMFNNNSANYYYGGAIYLSDYSNIYFNGKSTTMFSNNSANYYGGAIMSINYSHISFGGTSTTVFISNSADYGGAIFSFAQSYLSFKGKSNASFVSNNAEHGHGGAINFDGSNISFKGNSTVLFRNNSALQGGAMFSSHNSFVSFKEFSFVMFNGNMAIQDGGALYFTINSIISFSDLTNVSFSNNSAINGSALFAIYDSAVCFEGNAIVTFLKNEAVRSGGAAHFNLRCIVTMAQNANVSFENNNAVFGGAVCLNENTSITYKGNSSVMFKNNIAISDGGAVSILTNSSITVEESARITFTTNNAQYGGAMFFDATNTTLLLNNYKTGINFTRNKARIAGDYMYFDSTISGQNCLNKRIFGIKNETKRYITTPPSKLKFLTPAMCISYDNKTTKCQNYYLDHIMLGEEVNIPVCLLDYCNQPSYSRQFHIFPVNTQNYSITGSDQILLSCYDTFHGISITGSERLSNSSNFTINITLNDDRSSELKQISVNLIIQLTPCYPGFWQYPHSQKCDCYKAGDVMSCSGSSSTIKRGYWFGSVTGKPTVTICPVNYCNFTCCETSNGYYHLSPVRDNQCASFRSGTACGSCADGYTLTFDSTECVNIDTCTAGQTTLVVLLSVIYWIVMVTLVFGMMYYKVGIGYLYSIIYYYSIMDILLFQNLQTSKGLYITVSIMSSFSKIIPQFLGQLCLATGMSGIDQYFIHYLHPLAVILILVLISFLARKSMRISAIISRGILHVICLLILLSYTSIASTSLLLMRPLRFQDIDEVYTYLSPEIKYFHGRHLPYGIVALTCAIFIAIGLPALLILEPFLSRKFTFTKIKPLLDQFQGCYKDKYRCFAGYYMICRLLVITIFNANSYIGLLGDYLLIAFCGIIATIHLMVKPYDDKTLNNLDGMILQIIVLIAALPLLDNDYDSPFVTTMAFVLVFLPLIIFITMALYLHKDHLKKLVIPCMPKVDLPSCSNVMHDEIAMRNFDLIVDDNLRQNATICDM